ncbi:1566_t:CDS:2, partial [Dentiscutata erythropus]
QNSEIIEILPGKADTINKDQLQELLKDLRVSFTQVAITIASSRGEEKKELTHWKSEEKRREPQKTLCVILVAKLAIYPSTIYQKKYQKRTTMKREKKDNSPMKETVKKWLKPNPKLDGKPT